MNKEQIIYMYLDLLAMQGIINGKILNELLEKAGRSEYEVKQNEDLLNKQEALLEIISKLWR